MAMTARSSTSGAISSSRSRLCGCRQHVVLLKSKSITNPGKLFWKCPNWNIKDLTCNYFEWADEIIEEPGSSRTVDNSINEELRRISVKLDRKLGNERNRANMFMCLALVSLAVTSVTFVYCIVRCHCHV